MRVDREGLLAEGGVEHHVGGLAADAGERLQFLAGARHCAAVAVEVDQVREIWKGASSADPLICCRFTKYFEE